MIQLILFTCSVVPNIPCELAPSIKIRFEPLAVLSGPLSNADLIPHPEVMGYSGVSSVPSGLRGEAESISAMVIDGFRVPAGESTQRPVK